MNTSPKSASSGGDSNATPPATCLSTIAPTGLWPGTRSGCSTIALSPASSYAAKWKDFFASSSCSMVGASSPANPDCHRDDRQGTIHQNAMNMSQLFDFLSEPLDIGPNYWPIETTMKHEHDDFHPPFELHPVNSSAETAAYLRVCQETVRRLHRSKKLRAVPGLRKLLFTSDAIEEFLQGGQP
jgi:hypothetical protein